MRGVSVIVCCYNSVPRLPETIRHLAEQKTTTGTPWEVLIIDNASKDSTARVAQEEWNRYSCATAFRVIDEPEPGLTAARHRGYRESRFDYLLFCDDDNWLKENYVQTGFDVLSTGEDISVLGGQSEAVFETTAPDWFQRYALSYAVGKQYPESRDVTFQNKKLWGAGCFYRKSTLAFLYNNGFKQMMTDRIGHRIVSGGDHELCFAIRLAGFRLYYDERLYFKHFITAGRATWNWYVEFFRNAAFYSLYFDPYDNANRKPGWLKGSALYQIYLSARKLLSLKPSLSGLQNTPGPAADEKSFAVFYEKERILGLLRNGRHYRHRLANVREAKWRNGSK